MFRWPFRSKPDAPAAPAAQWRAQGNAALGRNALGEAEHCYRKAIETDPADPLARVSLGYVLLEQGRAAEAAECLTQAIARAGSQPDALADSHYLLSRVRRAEGDDSAAEGSLRAALAARPGFAEAARDLVTLLLAAGRAGDALEIARGAPACDSSPDIAMLLAQALHAAGDTPQAVAILDALLAREPAHAGALQSRGSLLIELGRAQAALRDFDQLLAARGPNPDDLCNRAAALLRLNRATDALASVDAALAIAPAHAQALHTRGQALLALLRVQEARDFSSEALRRLPDNADLEWNCAVAHLLLGEFEPGWRAHEARWRAAGFMPPPAAARLAPRWTGRESLRDATILLFAEQGLGDTIQFLRYVPLVAAQAREVLLQIPPEIAPLVNAPAANCRVVARGEALAVPDFQCPLLSLPHAFGTRVSSVPADIPYLQGEPGRVEAWRRRLGRGASKSVGIAWSGNPRHANDFNRSIPLREFRAIAGAPVQFVALQPQVREADRPVLDAWPRLLDAGPDLADFGDTAALLTALDLLVTVDTGVAHLAGALGRPVWILLPCSPDWRWMLSRTDSPWYPTARLYRQSAPGAWGAVLEQVAGDLRRLA